MPNDPDDFDALLDHVADIERCVARDAEALAMARERLATSMRDLDEVRTSAAHRSVGGPRCRCRILSTLIRPPMRASKSKEPAKNRPWATVMCR